MFTRLRSHILLTADVAKATKWYTDFLGKAPYYNEPYYVGFDVNGFELGLNPDVSNIHQGTNADAFWQVDNINEALDKALHLGAHLEQDIKDVGGGLLMAVFKDPFGNRIGLISG